jgi:K+-sensing histidine kinase KdpD
MNTRGYFDAFIKQVKRDQQGGVGFGLTICKYFVEAHGGAISMQATPRQDGTVVTFYDFLLRMRRRN